MAVAVVSRLVCFRARFGWRLALAGCLVLAAPAVSWAGDNPEYDRVKGEAKVAFKARRYEEAADLFRQAFDIEPRGNLLYNIGFCYEKSGDIRQAISNYERFVEAVPGSAKRAAVLRKIESLRKGLESQYLKVSVGSRPSGALIFVDDKAKGAMGAAPLDFNLLPGRYTIIAELDGHETSKKRIDVRPGQPVQITLTMVASGRVGQLQLRIAERGAVVKVDGAVVGKAPLAKPLRLSAGEHKVSVSKRGFGEWNQTVKIERGRLRKVTVDLSGGGGADLGGSGLSGGGGGSNIWPWVTMGVGTAMLAGGVYTGLSASGLFTQLEDKQKNDELIASQDIDTGNSLVMTTNVLLGVGAATLAGGLAWWLLGDTSPQTAGETRVMMGMTQDGQPGALLMGNF